MYKTIEYVPKIEPTSSQILSLIYTPGVGHACMKIKENDGLSYVYTNRENSVAVISFEYEKSLKRAIFLKSTLNIDAYPLECKKEFLKLVIENIYPNFCGIDLTIIADEVKDIQFEVEIPVLKSPHPNPPPQGGREIPTPPIDIKEFFMPFSKNIFNFNINQLEGNFEQQSLSLREKAGGVVETKLSENQDNCLPVALVSDGSAVLGFGNIGAAAAIPVMEGKAVIFKYLGGVDAISLCLKTQNPQEIITIVQALEKSFSGVNLEDICAPKCFDIEKALVERLNIPVFHDDQHGTAIVVLAALLNALELADKKIEDVKIVISGAGAAAQAVSKLLLSAGAKNIVHTNRKGIVVEGDENNDFYLEKLAQITNRGKIKGGLQDALKCADIFIGLSTAGVLKPEFIKEMKQKPIIFALANPTPEIMPDEALKEGAFIVATGRSDFDNQINNSLAFPGLFKSLIVNKINKVTDQIKLKCAIAIASLIKKEDLTAINILPNALDPRVPHAIINSFNN